MSQRMLDLQQHFKSIVAIKIDDSPGGLHKAAYAIAKENINIEDAYGFTIREKIRRYLYFRLKI
jgi:hypothetical protein